jgi:hypothetical protein
MEDSDILPYLHQDRIPPVDNSTRLQRLERTLGGHRSYRAGKTVLGPVNKRISVQWKAHPRRVSAVVLLLTLALAGGVYAIAGPHTFPTSPGITGGTAPTTSSCGATGLAYPSLMPSGTAGMAQVATVDCVTGATHSPAFTVSATGSDSVTFTLPTAGVPATSLGIVLSPATCTIGGAGETLLTPGTGTPVSLTAGSYNYCVHYNVPPPPGGTIASFTLSWAT